MSIEKVAILKALADPSRLLLLNALLEKPHCVEELAERLRRSASTISFHLRKLEEAGLVSKTRTQYYSIYEARGDVLATRLVDFVRVACASDSPEKRRLHRYRERVVRAFMKGGVLTQLPRQWKKRLIILDEVAKKFELGVELSEARVNERILALYPDYCTIRRMLVDEGYMTRDGQTYRLVKSASEEEPAMATRAELKRQYKETEKQAGVFRIANTKSGKVLLGGSKNLHGPLNRHRFMLEIGSHPNAELQKDWNEQGADAFRFEVVEVVERRDTPDFSLEEELAALERRWVEKTQPLGERSYNQDEKIRD